MSIPAHAAQGHDPEWPCIQRKVPTLSLPQIWNGPAIPESASSWQRDKDIEEKVRELAQRRIPIPEAQTEIRDYAKTLEAGEKANKLFKLVQGLFDHMNMERSQVISGIGRYARGQAEMAARLRREGSQLGALQTDTSADILKLQQLTERMTLQTRIFEERVQSLTFVCEVPTIIEQRLYALAKTVNEELGKK